MPCTARAGSIFRLTKKASSVHTNWHRAIAKQLETNADDKQQHTVNEQQQEARSQKNQSC
jgi:hypothetical protein